MRAALRRWLRALRPTTRLLISGGLTLTAACRHGGNLGVSTAPPIPPDAALDSPLPKPAPPPRYAGPTKPQQVLPMLPNLSARRCQNRLRKMKAPARFLAPSQFRGVRTPVRPTGPLGGVRYRFRGESKVHEVMDCRLALALAIWGKTLVKAQVESIEHLSAYRPGAKVDGSKKVSGHARGLALDIAIMTLRNGQRLNVDKHWRARRRGADPCDFYGKDTPQGQLLRALVCEAADDGLFQTLLTPHHDKAHGNHVHAELVPNVSWQYLH